jgi:hypothetical protein
MPNEPDNAASLKFKERFSSAMLPYSLACIRGDPAEDGAVGLAGPRLLAKSRMPVQPSQAPQAASRHSFLTAVNAAAVE